MPEPLPPTPDALDNHQPAEVPQAKKAVADLTPQLVTEPANLPPGVLALQHSAPWYREPQALHKHWQIGYLPAAAAVPPGLASLRERIVFPVRDQVGQLLGYVGRDPDFERKSADWLQAENPEGPGPQEYLCAPPGQVEPAFLFGQERLTRRGVKGKIRQAGGLLLVERPEDVVRLAQGDLVALGMLWQQAEEQFVQAIAALAAEHGDSRVRPLLDLDPNGRKAMLQRVVQLCTATWVRVAWTSKVLGGRFAGKQPAQLSDEDLAALREVLRSTAE